MPEWFLPTIIIVGLVVNAWSSWMNYRTAVQNHTNAKKNYEFAKDNEENARILVEILRAAGVIDTGQAQPEPSVE